MAIAGKATPTMVKVTVFVTVDRAAYVKEYGEGTPSKSDLIEEVRDIVDGTLTAEGSRFSVGDGIYSVTVL